MKVTKFDPRNGFAKDITGESGCANCGHLPAPHSTPGPCIGEVMACENCQSKDRVLILLVAMMTVIGAAIVALVDRMSSIEAYTSLQEQCNGYISMANSQLVLASQNCRRDYGDNNISISSYCYMRCDDDRPA